MCMPHHIQTLARTYALALVCICAWICLCAGMSTSASATTLASTRDIQSLTGIQNARSTTRANILLGAAATPAADTTIARIEVHSGTAIVSLTPPTSSGSSGLAYYQSTCSAAGQASVTSRSSAASNSVLIENLTPGISYDCTFSAYNLDGLGSPESAYITVLVSAGNTTVSIASPADGAVFSVPAPNNGAVGTAVPITATVTTASGAVLSKIEYFESTHSIGISSITSYAWTPLVPGIYTVTAKVTDSKGATGVSAPVIITVADASGETITFLHNDFAGSAIAATDAAGALLWKENYTPFGDRAVKAVNATGNRQWYTGKPVDSETGLSNFGARMYDPVIGRFMGVDAVGFNPGNLQSFNRYAYANNNPYKFVDPSGNSALSLVDWYDFGKDVGGLWIDIGIYTAASVLGNKDVQHLASQGMEAGVGAAALSTVGIINPVPGTSRAIKTEIQAVEIGSKIEKAAVGAVPKPPTGVGSVPPSERDPTRLFSKGEIGEGLAQQGGKCVQCGQAKDLSEVRGHHVKRHADGGQTTSENLAVVCKTCHKELHKAE